VATYIFALLLIAAFSIAFHFIADSIVHEQEESARIVNISGRQRMLCQRIARLALERAAHSAFRPDAETQAALSEAIGRMEQAHQSLLHGSAADRISALSVPEVAQVYFGNPWQLDARTQQFLAHARALASRPAASLTVSDSDLIAVEEAAQRPLLDALNAAVSANEAHSERAIGLLRRRLTLLTCLMLVILLLEALFLYRPLFNRLSRSRAELIEAGRTDPLTGCLNRRAFTQEAGTALVRARTDGRLLAVLMVDIDHFKRVNDRFGHPAGDLVINTVVDTFLKTIRTTDILCRMGGEEFALLLPRTTLQDAITVAEYIRNAVAGRVIAIPDGSAQVSVTVSIGLATLQPGDSSIFDVLGRADQAVYLAKSNGRNRTETEQDIPPGQSQTPQHAHGSRV
jgi:diguanylate cyclase (GGDEF)-like protein